MMFTADPVDAATAERIGLINRVVPADQLMAEATALAARLAKSAPIALALAKRALNRTYDMNLEEALDLRGAAPVGGRPLRRPRGGRRRVRREATAALYRRVTATTRKAIEDRLEKLFADLYRLTDPELRAVRLIWESENQFDRRRAYEKGRETVDREKRMDLVEEAQSGIKRWIANYLTGMTGPYAGFPTGSGSGMDTGEVRRGAIPPVMDAVVAIVGGDGLDPDEQDILLAPISEVIAQHEFNANG